MAMLAIKVSESESRIFRGIDVPGDRDESDHITLFYFGDNIPIKSLAKVMSLVLEITEKFKPFHVETNKITTFSKGNKGYPIIADINSDDLQKLRKKIKKVFDENKVSYSNKFPTYKPHITLSYSKEKIDDLKINKCKWVVSEIALYGGDSDVERVYVSFPFGGSIKKHAEYINYLTELWIEKQF